MKATDLRVLLAIDGPERIRAAERTAAEERLTKEGLVFYGHEIPGHLELTPRGMAFVEALLALKLPEQVTQWKVPE